VLIEQRGAQGPGTLKVPLRSADSPAVDASSDDDALVEAVRAGDGVAFGVLFERHGQSVFRACRRRVASRQDAEDVLSATFLEAWRIRARAVAVEGSMRPWLLAIAANLSRNHARAARRRELGTARAAGAVDHVVPGPEDEVVASVGAAADAAVLEVVIQALPEGERDVVELCLVEGLSSAQAAHVLEIPEGTVRSRVFRARIRLRAALLQQGERAPGRERLDGSGHHQVGRQDVASAAPAPVRGPMQAGSTS
jgi:RNA polymerase sigma-70 factor (ECF subfamily)